MADDVERELKRLAGEAAVARERLADLKKKLVGAREVIARVQQALDPGQGTGQTGIAQGEAKAG